MGRPDLALDVEELAVGDHPTGQQGHHPFAGVVHRLRASARSSSRSPTRDGTGRPPSPLWVGEALDAKPMAPAAMDSATACLHAGEFLGGGGPLVGILPHDVHPHGGVAHVTPVVERGAAALDGVEVLRKGLELVPGHAHGQRVEAHVLHVLQRAGQQAVPARAGWVRWRSRSSRRPRWSRRGTTTGVSHGSQNTWAS